MDLKLILKSLGVCEVGYNFAASRNFDCRRMWYENTEAGWFLWLARKARVDSRHLAKILVVTSEMFPVPDNKYVCEYVHQAKLYLNNPDKNAQLDVEPYEAQYIVYYSQKTYGGKVLPVVRNMLNYGMFFTALEQCGKAKTKK